MSDHMQTIRDDLAYLRALAEEGRSSGERGGAIGLAAGLIFAACSVVQWAALTGRVSPAWSNGSWIGGVLLFFAVLVLVKRRMGAGASQARAGGAAWTGVGWAIFVLFGAMGVASWRTHSANLIFFAPSIILALYGAAWTVAAAISGKGWVRLTAIGSFVGCVVCAWFIGDAVQYLIYAAALLLLAALPGAMLMRQDIQGKA